MKTFVITAITRISNANVILVHGMTVDTYKSVIFTTDTSMYKELKSIMNTVTPITLDLPNI